MSASIDAVTIWSAVAVSVAAFIFTIVAWWRVPAHEKRWMMWGVVGMGAIMTFRLLSRFLVPNVIGLPTDVALVAAASRIATMMSSVGFAVVISFYVWPRNYDRTNVVEDRRSVRPGSDSSRGDAGSAGDEGRNVAQAAS